MSRRTPFRRQRLNAPHAEEALKRWAAAGMRVVDSMVPIAERGPRCHRCYNSGGGCSMIALKVTTVGNSAGVVLPKEVLARLKIQKGDTLYLVETPDGYQLTPYDEVFARQVRAAEEVLRDHRDVLRELAR